MVRACAAVLAALVGAGAGQAATEPKVFDRTYVCSSGDGGPRIFGQPFRESDRSAGSVVIEKTFTGGTHEIFWVDARWGVHVDAQQCKRSTNRVPLTRTGLTNPPMAVGGVKCPVGKFLLRVRYTYVPGEHPTNTIVGGRLVLAEVAVRTYARLKPLAYVRLTADGKTFRLYSAYACTPSSYGG
jgi:hypothetical protein